MPTVLVPWIGLVRAIRDDGYTRENHTSGGKRVIKDKARGRETHVFLDSLDLDVMETMVWTHGAYFGQIGIGHRAIFERFGWRSPVAIGVRIKAGTPDIPLHWVEIKGRLDRGDWIYHLAPRTRPAS